MKMKIFTCRNFDGHWPVGVAAVIVAKDEEKARQLLDWELRAIGLELGDATLTKVDVKKPAAFILADGNY